MLPLAAIGMGMQGAGVGASIYDTISSASSQKKANESNERIARENREFQERMSSTSHSREVEDLKRAGLNPILSAGGGGSSTPPGATATMQPTYPGQGATNAVRLVNEARLANEQINTQKSQQNVNSATAAKTVNEVQKSNPAANIMSWIDKLITSAKEYPQAMREAQVTNKERNRIEKETKTNQIRMKQNLKAQENRAKYPNRRVNVHLERR